MIFWLKGLEMRKMWSLLTPHNQTHLRQLIIPIRFLETKRFGYDYSNAFGHSAYAVFIGCVVQKWGKAYIKNSVLLKIAFVSRAWFPTGLKFPKGIKQMKLVRITNLMKYIESFFHCKELNGPNLRRKWSKYKIRQEKGQMISYTLKKDTFIRTNYFVVIFVSEFR